MGTRTASLFVLVLITTAVMLAATSRAADVCMAEGTFNITSTTTLSTPDGNFSINFLFLITLARSGSGYNVTVVGKITNITGPPVLLQARLPLFDFAVSTDEGEYRWSDGKVFTAVLLPLSSGTTYRMSMTGIEASCIKSVTVDATGLGLPGVVTIGEGNTSYAFTVMSTSTMSTRVPHGVTDTQTMTTSMHTTTTAYSGGGYTLIPPGKAVYGGVDEGLSAERNGVERNVVAAVIALLAALGVGLLLYTLFT